MAITKRDKTTTIHAIVSAMATGGCSYTLHLEGLEEQKRREKEDRMRRAARRITRRQRTRWVRQWLLRRPMHGQYEKHMHELMTEDQSAYVLSSQPLYCLRTLSIVTTRSPSCLRGWTSVLSNVIRTMSVTSVLSPYCIRAIHCNPREI